MDRYLLGIDIGSGGCKVSLLNIDRKETITEAAEYLTYFPRAGWAEQDAEDWVINTGRLVRLIIDKAEIEPSSLYAIGIGGVTHSPVILDKKRKPVRRTIHLTDTRSVKQAQYLKGKAGDLILRTGFNSAGVMWTSAMLLWVKENEPETWEKMSRILFPKDYVRFRLTGTEVTDHIDAQGTLLFNTAEGKWDDRLISLIDLEKAVLPETVNPSDVVGKVTDEGAGWSGLKAGTPVIAGSTDTLLEVMASGSRSPGDCTVKLATFGRICVITEKPIYDEKLITYSYILPGLWYPGTGTKSCASSLKWFRDQFCRDMKGEVFSIMEKEARSIPPGAEGLIFHPYLQGEGSPYNDPFLRGDFIGLTLHQSRGHLIRAVMEGTAFSLLDSINYLKEKGISIKGPLRFIGGGTLSTLWLNILSDVLGQDGVVPEATDPSVGAALLAGVGTGVFNSVEEAQEQVKGHVREIKHDEGRSEFYGNLFELYKKANEKLISIYHKLSEFSLK